MLSTYMSRRPVQIALALGTIYLIWGSTYLGIRFAIETLPPYLMSGTRFILAGTLLYGWSRWRGATAPAARHWRSAAVIGGLMLLGGNGSVAWAEQRVPSGIAALVIATVPLWIVLLAWLWQKGARPGLRVVAGLGLGFAGIFLLVNQGPGAGEAALDTTGILVLLLAALSWAIGSLCSRTAPQPGQPLLAVAMQMLAGGIFLVLAGSAGGEWQLLQPAAVSGKSLLAWAYLLVFGSMLGFSCYIWLLRVAPPEQAASYAYVNPVVAVFLGWFLADEVLTWQTLLASAVIITAVILLTRRKQAAKAAPQGDETRPETAAVLQTESIQQT